MLEVYTTAAKIRMASVPSTHANKPLEFKELNALVPVRQRIMCYWFLQGLFHGSVPKPHYAMIKLDHALIELFGHHTLQRIQNVMWSIFLFDVTLKHKLYCSIK